MLGNEALVVLAILSQIMTEKMEDTILHVCGWVNDWISIAVVRLYSCTIRGAWPLILLQDMEPDWKSSLGIGLAQKIARQNSFAPTCAKLFHFLPDLTFTYLY